MSHSSQRVLMVVANDIRRDTRVLKSALALADAGHTVTILGLASSGFREDTQYGPVRIIRVPNPWRLRDLAKKRQRTFLKHRSTPEPRTRREAELDTMRTNNRIKELQESGPSPVARAEIVGHKVWDRVVRRGVTLTAWLARRFESKARGGTVKIHRRVPIAASWRRDLPELIDYDLAYGPVIDSLQWDVIHAHDVHHLSTVARAVARRRAQGQPARWVYDAHEFVAGLPVYPQRSHRDNAAYLDLERQYIRRADAVITVTEPLAEELQRRYRLTDKPTVVMNAPEFTATPESGGSTVREACGLTDDTPLIVYSGGVTRARGVHTVVEALAELPGVHLAVVCVPHNQTDPVKALAELAEDLGVTDRVHFLNPVSPSAVSSFLSAADLAVHPMVHFGSHEFALPNKLFEYLYAGLPLVVSDCRALSQFVRQNDLGGVFAAEDASSCAAAITEVLGRGQYLRARIANDGGLLEPYSWSHQARTLADLYARLGDRPSQQSARLTHLSEVHEEPLPLDRSPLMLGVGPANFAGQGWQWARATQQAVPGLTTEVVTIDNGGPMAFHTDVRVPVATFSGDEDWAHEFGDHVVNNWTHALFEAVKPILGSFQGNTFAKDSQRLLGAGIRVGVIFHGSELRNPARHAANNRWSPFADPDDPLTAALQRQTDALFPMINDFVHDRRGPAFVSTPDLLDDLPSAIWVPLVVDPDQWHSDRPVLEDPRPLVVHAPTNAKLKGTDRALAALQELADDGTIRLRHLDRVPPAEMPHQLAQADIILDQFALGSYGALAVESLASGRLVLGHVSDHVRGYVREATGQELPIVEANVDTLPEVLRSLLADRDHSRAVAVRGPEFVRHVHDGRLSGNLLADQFGIR